MKRLPTALGTLIFCIACAGCQTPAKPTLVGSWEATHNRNTMTKEFRPDGTYTYQSTMGMFAVRLDGKYKLVGDTLTTKAEDFSTRGGRDPSPQQIKEAYAPVEVKISWSGPDKVTFAAQSSSLEFHRVRK